MQTDQAQHRIPLLRGRPALRPPLATVHKHRAARVIHPDSARDFIPVSSEHVFSDSRLPTVADATVRVFIRSYDPERGVYVNQEVLDPSCMMACRSAPDPAL